VTLLPIMWLQWPSYWTWKLSLAQQISLDAFTRATALRLETTHATLGPQAGDSFISLDT